MRREKIHCRALGAILFALSVPAEAQQPAKAPKIGLLGARPGASSTGLELFRQELRKLGYIEDKNIAFEYRSADNKLDRLPALADIGRRYAALGKKYLEIFPGAK